MSHVVEKDKLHTLRGLLRDWARWVRDWRPPLGLPGHVPYLHEMRPSAPADAEFNDGPDAWVMQQIDIAIDALGPGYRHAIRVRYLREIGPAVFRSGRMTAADVRRLVDDAEVRLVPLVEARHVVL